MKDLPEFKDIAEEEDRKNAFDKFIKRQRVSQASSRLAQSDSC